MHAYSKNEKQRERVYIVKERLQEKGMIDSGANISIARKSLAENMGLEIKQYQKRVVIQFGKEGAKSVAKGYANFGELLGDIAIVEDAHETLIKMDTFTDRGMVVEFQGDKVRIKEQNGDGIH